MSDKTLSRVLSDAYEQTIKKAPSEHPERTADCPSIPEFERGMRTGWSDKDRSHIGGCTYCQKLMAFDWGLNPPGLWSFAQFTAGVFPYSMAMRFYLERDHKARNLQNSIVVRKLAAFIQKLNGLAESIKTLPPEFASQDWFGLNSVTFAQGRGAIRTSARAPEDELNRIRDWSNAVAMIIPDEERPVELRVSTPDGTLSICVSAFADGLDIRATSRGIENAARRVFIELLPEEGEPIQVTLQMLPDETNDHVHSNRVVPLGGAHDFLTTCSLVAAWIG